MTGQEGLETWDRLGRGWHFLSQVVVRGVTPETLPLLREFVPETALTERFDADQAAARHHEIFGLNVPAREGIYVDASGRLRKDERDALLRAYSHGGYWPPDIDLADALDVEMYYAGALCRIKVAAYEKRDGKTFHEMSRIEVMFLYNHLLRWIAPCCAALAQQGDALYAAVASLILEFAAKHVETLDLAVEPSLQPVARSWPAAPDLLADPATRLDDIAARLAAPVLTGFLLDRATLRRAARELDLPAPFADRHAMLAGLLRAAGEYDALPALLDRLHRCAQEAAQAYAATRQDLPVLASWVFPWEAQCQETRVFLTAMRAAAA